MKKLLPINLDPCIRTYTHHGYFHAVTCTDDKVNQDIKKEVASIQVNSISQYNWDMQLDQLDYKIVSHNNIRFYGNKWNTNMNAAFWRECKLVDELEIEIYEQLYSNAFANIIIFLARDHDNSMTDIDSSYEFQFGNYSKDGLFYRVKAMPHKNVFTTVDKPIKLSLRREGNIITIKSNSGDNQQIKISDNILIDRIGFAVNLGCNSYYEWLFSNYINIFLRITDPMPIDYLCNVHKNWHTNTNDYFLDYRIETSDSIESLGFSLIDYIIKMIDLNRYIEILINDNIHMGLSKDRAPYFHQNLIYGYDNSQKFFYVLFIKEGKIASTTMNYSDFMSKENFLPNRTIYMYEYNSGYELFKLSTKHILQIFNEYKASQNMSFYEPYYDYENYSFGLNCLERLNSEDGMQGLIEDIRISHLIYERSVCNKNRVEYLYYKQIIDKKSFKEISQVSDVQCEKALILRNSILKTRMCGRPGKDVIKNHLIDFISYEHIFVDIIIDILSKIEN